MAYKPTLRVNGEKMIDVKIEISFNAKKLATAWADRQLKWETVCDSYGHSESTLVIPLPKTVRELVDVARQSVVLYGVETPSYRLGDDGILESDEYANLVAHIKELVGCD